jgi:hypothetical protein
MGGQADHIRLSQALPSSRQIADSSELVALSLHKNQACCGNKLVVPDGGATHQDRQLGRQRPAPAIFGV